MACFLGKRNLEVVIAKLASSESKFVKRPEITVYFLKSQVFKVPTLAEIEKVIKDALGGTSEEDTDYITKHLLNHVNGTIVMPEIQRSLGFLRRIVEGSKKTLTLRMHCEAVAAALLESGDRSDQLKLAEVRGCA